MITIRRYRPTDLAGIMRIERASFSKDAWPRELFEYYGKACGDLFLLARADGALAGYSITCVRKDLGDLVSIAVLPRFRGRGIGAILLRRSINRLRRTGATAVSLMVRRDNSRAVELYRGFGFTRTATVKGYYEDGSTGWRMRLSL